MNPDPRDRFQAPDGFVLVRSHLDGVEVYAPAAVDEALEQRTRCPSCGASVEWDPATQAVLCRYCGSSAEATRGREAGPGEFTASALHKAHEGWGAERPELACDGCGGVLTLDLGQLATTCPFCGSNAVAVRRATERSMRPGHVLPFAVQRAEATRVAKAWVGQGWMRPAGVVKAARLDRFLGLYLPYWIFSAQLGCTYEVEVGRDRWVTETRNGRTRRRRVTDWSWKRGTVRLASGELVVSATERVAGLDRTGPFPVAERIPYTPDVLVGFAAHGFDIGLSEAWEIGRDRMRTLAAEAARAEAGGDRQRHFSASVDLSGEVWHYALLPVWVSTYSFGGARWVALVNGVTGEVGGTRPVDWTRVYTAMALLFAPGLFLGVCVGLPTLLFAGFGLVVWVFALILLGIAAVAAVALYSAAIAEEHL